MEIVDVVRKLIGPIEPVGETHTDNERLENIKVMTALVDELLQDISDVAKHEYSTEHSRKKSGRHAGSFFRYIYEEYKQ